jgi:hypothetical protein
MMAAQQQWQPNSDSSPIMMAAQQQQLLGHRLRVCLLVRVRALPEGHCESTRQYPIARRAREDASAAGGMSQEHGAIHDCKASL